MTYKLLIAKESHLSTRSTQITSTSLLQYKQLFVTNVQMWIIEKRDLRDESEIDIVMKNIYCRNKKNKTP